MATTKKTYTRNCDHCGNDYQTYSRRELKGCRSVCGSRECNNKEATQHNAEVAAYEAARPPRAPRRTRTPQPLYGDYAWIAIMNGIRTDGTGRKA